MSIFVGYLTFCIKNVKAIDDYYLIIRMKVDIVSSKHTRYLEIVDRK